MPYPILTNTSLYICLPDCMAAGSCKGWTDHMPCAQAHGLVAGTEQTVQPSPGSKAEWLGTSALRKGSAEEAHRVDCLHNYFQSSKLFQEKKRKINTFFWKRNLTLECEQYGCYIQWTHIQRTPWLKMDLGALCFASCPSSTNQNVHLVFSYSGYWYYFLLKISLASNVC